MSSVDELKSSYDNLNSSLLAVEDAVAAEQEKVNNIENQFKDLQASKVGLDSQFDEISSGNLPGFEDVNMDKALSGAGLGDNMNKADDLKGQAGDIKGQAEGELSKANEMKDSTTEMASDIQEGKLPEGIPGTEGAMGELDAAKDQAGDLKSQAEGELEKANEMKDSATEMVSDIQEGKLPEGIPGTEGAMGELDEAKGKLDDAKAQVDEAKSKADDQLSKVNEIKDTTSQVASDIKEGKLPEGIPGTEGIISEVDELKGSVDELKGSAEGLADKAQEIKDLPSEKIAELEESGDKILEIKDKFKV